MELSKETLKYWKEKDFADLGKAESIRDLYVIADRIIDRMPKPIIQVCGPLSTGGKSIEENLHFFNESIKKLQSDNLCVFDQMPFEPLMHRMILQFSKDKYMEDILIDFYLPIFESKKIGKLCFLSGWQLSHGASWEHEQAERLGLSIEYL